jgi:hypothetical protein
MLCVRDEEKNVLHLQLDAGRGKSIIEKAFLISHYLWTYDARFLLLLI